MHGLSELESVLRPAMAVMLIAIGLAMFFWPDWLANLGPYFSHSAARLPPAERERLTRVLIARQFAEGISNSYGRYLGIAAMAMGALVPVTRVPLIVAYLLLCLTFAVVMLLVYIRLDGATNRRAAPLVRRSPLKVLSPLVVASVACSLAVTLALMVYPQLRLSAIVVVASMIVLAFIGWRVAGAPTLLLGADLQFELVVDERLRTARANNTIGLACAPPYFFIMLARDSLPHHGASLFAVEMVLWAAFMSVLLTYIVLSRSRIPLT